MRSGRHSTERPESFIDSEMPRTRKGKAEDEKPLRARRMAEIGHVESERVAECLDCLVEAHAMLPQVPGSLGGIPLKEVRHCLSVD